MSAAVDGADMLLNSMDLKVLLVELVLESSLQPDRAVAMANANKEYFKGFIMVSVISLNPRTVREDSCSLVT